ncbi:DUF1269 domain-containing protein [Rhodococcus sp. BP-252]|uniref:DUF6325 family protein n=1 Tax=unclassified Rhodococcus (in: high G+C Gram-positive bacteria) TaxID=192944 RepID=UPI0014316DC2|nr:MULTISPECIES: DUF6325 family protein [unclassified Rhodococcus (in: high G+C Gram-positive bacteria)]MBY6410831.1 DUF1269 domain-containing protein [Rhodococcus sp. BP-320]MBY6415344.1 DUF1269 domain-containing protein [Rhodococcus sp. BP-321]MBY6419959.1 DUF1269 domain-containing protein [Rhodococcus sp. BP-324]MBY6425387.1 DUF1269 domain-containing protein [Rhodococcus sp. BP-323]MBY6430550.1 DUF1269 domain-containing protein [Rhodococcus sp. BP-322]
MNETMFDVGPVGVLVVTFPGDRADPAVVAALAQVVEQRVITLLDLVFIGRSLDGSLRQVDVDEALDDVGLEILSLEAKALISDEDLDVVRGTLEPGTSAAILVYEQTWARTLSHASREAGGDVALHVQIPRETVEVALAAALV